MTFRALCTVVVVVVYSHQGFAATKNSYGALRHFIPDVDRLFRDLFNNRGACGL